MNLRHLEIFVAVCECGSMTEAAERLFMAQPAVSLAISELEQHYGTKLFDRISRKLFITAAGRQLLDRAMYIISLFRDMEVHMQSWETTTTLRIGSSLSIAGKLLPQYIQQFSLQYPKIKVKVQINASDKIKDMVLANELDFAFVEGMVWSDYLHWENYMEDELLPICSPKHPFAGRVDVSLQELVSEPLLLRETGSGTREVFDYVLGLDGLHAEPLWESASTPAILEGVCANIGVSVLPLRLLEDFLQNNRIATFAVQGAEFRRHFKIIYHKRKYLPECALAFIDLAKSVKASRESAFLAGRTTTADGNQS